MLSLALALCVEDDLKIGVIFWTSYLHDSRYIPIPPSFLTITYIEEKRPVDLEIGADRSFLKTPAFYQKPGFSKITSFFFHKPRFSKTPSFFKKTRVFKTPSFFKKPPTSFLTIQNTINFTTFNQ